MRAAIYATKETKSAASSAEHRVQFANVRKYKI